jgi:hypothetical protein
MATAIFLVLLAVTCRLLAPVFHLWNFVPMGAVALYAGARLPRRWAWSVPLVAMLIADFLLDHGSQWPLVGLTRWTIYATFAATTLLGPLANRPKFRRWLLPLLALSASSLFFVTSNLATWAEGTLYPMTLPGLLKCYIAAIPFFKYTLLADLLGTGLLFGLGPIVERVASRWVASRVGAPVREPDAAETHQPA